MDKTVSISLGGFSFIIDEVAYSKLKTYLQDVRTSLRGTEGIEDIIEDVEIRISELFRDRIKYKEVVSNDDVDFVIATMGHPNQYKVEEEGEDSTDNSNYSNTAYQSYETRTNKRLFRDPDDKIMTGLSSGLAHYLGLDPWAVRATWLVLGVLGIFTGFSFLLVVFCYIVLLIFVPKATTTSEKLQMYGKPANIETFKKNAELASEAVVSGGRELSNKLGSAFGWFGRIMLWFIGFLLLSTGIGLIIAAFVIFFSSITTLPVELFGYLVEEPWMSVASKILGGILMVIPGVLISILGAKCFTRFSVSKIAIVSSIIVWFIALFGLIGVTVSTASKFRTSVENRKDQVFTIPNDTLIVDFVEQHTGTYKFKSINDLDQLIDENGDLIIPIDDKLRIKESDDDNFRLEIKYKSKGGNSSEARKNIESITYNYKIENNKLILDEFIKIPKNGKFRNQDIDIYLYVPKNKFINVKSAREVIVYETDEDHEYYHQIKNNIFGFNGKNIVCLNCKSNDYDLDELQDIDEQINIHINEGNDSAKVLINKNGIRVKGKNSSVGLHLPSTNKKDNEQINYKDDSDSININYGNHRSNR